jgi:hypothetical protein
VSAGLFGTLLEYPQSPVHRAVPDPLHRRMLMGLAMGLTAVAILYSPWGKQSGAHVNPATTLTFWRLGKVAGADAAFYVAFQFVGGLGGVFLVTRLLGDWFVEPPVRALATSPGERGLLVAFAAEAAITFVLMTVVLVVSNTPRLAPWTGLFVGALHLPRRRQPHGRHLGQRGPRQSPSYPQQGRHDAGQRWSQRLPERHRPVHAGLSEPGYPRGIPDSIAHFTSAFYPSWSPGDADLAGERPRSDTDGLICE